MKSDFMLAFNQICSERNLPREVVLEAILTALVSAYRRNIGAPPSQNVTAQIDLDTGNARVFVERMAVAEVTDPQTEILLEKARTLKSDVTLEESLMVEDTPRDFGRIAAQTARQVILQRIREAEREAQYAHYVEQEGELIYGTVQSVSPHQITLHLERTEAVLPRKETVPGERYLLHDRVRAYVTEVRRTSRGPQIVVSRSHKKMLQRLLELEVPEITNGTVEIKSIAREAGARSKVAVAARQAGVDPVGACVGMRGVRIQSIVKELGGEKVDIIEWSPDPITFVAKALGPAKILSVILEEDPVEGRTASVVVPDDQLSLAIGRAGQNARLAAKLTSWRVDIQGVTEAAEWALEQVNENSEVLPHLEQTAELLPTVSTALRRHNEEKLPYNAEELLAMRQVIEGVRGFFIAARDARRARLLAEETARKAALDEARTARKDAIRQARALIPPTAFEISLSEIGLDTRVLGHLNRNDLATVGDVLEHLAEGDEGLLKLDGIGPKGLAQVREALDRLDLPQPIEELEAQEEILTETVDVEPVAEQAPLQETVAVLEAAPASPDEVGPEAPSAEEPEEQAPGEPKAEPVVVVTPDLEAEELMEAVLAGDWDGDEEDKDDEEDDGFTRSDRRKRRQKSRRLVYDEDADKVIAVRRHRRGEGEEGWEEIG